MIMEMKEIEKIMQKVRQHELGVIDAAIKFQKQYQSLDHQLTEALKPVWELGYIVRITCMNNEWHFDFYKGKGTNGKHYQGNPIQCINKFLEEVKGV